NGTARSRTPGSPAHEISWAGDQVTPESRTAAVMGERSEQAFDVIVVGGGSAGCVLAARMSDKPGCSVCLIEGGPAGGPPRAGAWPARTPAGVSELLLAADASAVECSNHRSLCSPNQRTS